MQCHAVGKPNKDGSVGTCTSCHARHVASVELARLPTTCGQCHMGPDHSQLEIYHESKHGVLFNQQRAVMNLKADPKRLTTTDMAVPTCATCHMSGLEGQKFTHDVTERLSYFLFADVSGKRPNFQFAQTNMKETCNKCHTTGKIDTYYKDAEAVVASTNEAVGKASEIIKKLRAEGLLTPDPMDEPIELLYFDLWHYGGRTAKHGAFMGGADFVQWHGF
jgi:hydroxylamine dehydrogenase